MTRVHKTSEANHSSQTKPNQQQQERNDIGRNEAQGEQENSIWKRLASRERGKGTAGKRSNGSLEENNKKEMSGDQCNGGV